MSNYTTRATAVLMMNTEQIKAEIPATIERINKLKKALADAAAAGHTGLAKQLRKELREAQKDLKLMESAVNDVARVMQNLDKASPKQLNAALKQLNRELQEMERGTAAWNRQVEKIRQVKAELVKVNTSLVEQDSLWQKFSKKLFLMGNAIFAVQQALTQVIQAGRAAVNAYASMDEQMTNTVKYTGMAREEVEKMNEAFAGLNSRLTREKMNEFAQEAGRLGKNTRESVQGYVEAANILSVALVDLGEGATQEIAKLTNIFGVEEALGTRDAMLSVGSAVNVLSQNCTASKPYLVEFTKRLGGIGAQANMTIQEILAFGATLDANGQKVEMSASALSRLIMMLFQKPGEIAQKVGLDMQQFTDTLNRSTNEGIIMFLDKLHEMGEQNALAALSPLFKDLGMDGIRMAQVLASLAQHIDMVKWEQVEANKAFSEATSATREYELFNNTVQAGIDKARNRLHELAISLGQQLLPIMRHIYTSSGAMLRLLNVIVGFIIEYRGSIISLTAAYAAYTVAVKASVIATKADAAAKVVAKAATVAWTAVTQLAYAAVAVLSGNLKKAAMEMRIFSAVIHASPIGLLVASITAACAGLFLLVKRFGDNTKAAMEAEKKHREYLQSLRDVDSASKSYSESELARLRALYAATMNEKLARDKRIEAVKEMQRLYPNVFSNFTTEEIMAGKAKSAYDELTDSIIKNARARAAAEKIFENEKEILELEQERDKLRGENKEAFDKVQSAAGRRRQAAARDDERRSVWQEGPNLDQSVTELDRTIRTNTETIEGNRKTIHELDEKIKDRRKANEWLQSEYNVTGNENSRENGNGGGEIDVDYTPESSSDGKSGRGRSGKSAKEDKFADEKAWREKEEALNQIAYRTGEKNFQQYTERMLEIERDFYQMQLAHTDIGETERLKILAQYHEATQKMRRQYGTTAVEEEDAEYAIRLAELKQYYLDGVIEVEAYNGKLKEMELEHLAQVAEIRRSFAEAHPEDDEAMKAYVKAQDAYQKMIIQDQKEKQKAYEAQLKEHQKQMSDIWDKYFVSDKEKRQQQYNQALALVEEAYREEIAKEGYTAEEKLEIERRYQEALKKLREEFLKDDSWQNKSMEDYMGDLFKKIFPDADWEKWRPALENMYASVSSVYQSLNQMAQAEDEIRLANIKKRYDAEISMAEGNAYKVKELEKKRTKEEAKIKAEASKRQFAQQVVAALAQTATAALNAYSSTAAIPVVGPALAPIAAAIAVAAGMMQVAAIKKQQAASLAQGYAQGGFTRAGRPDEPAGIVHAGEWVASQKLLQIPQARAAVEALDYAQRNNAYGILKGADVSRQLTAPSVLAQSQPQVIISENPELREVIGRLNERLNQPFVTVNTVTGDLGTKRAQDDYQALINNTLPKSKRK